MKVTISKAHVRIFRAIEGAVRNTLDGHPRWSVPRDFGRSVAKRATGTLTATWPDVLAAHNEPSEASRHGDTTGRWPPRRVMARSAKGAVATCSRRSPLRQTFNEISSMAGQARRAGDEVRLVALVDVLRIISRKLNAPR